jgi:hypothetical protein
MQHVFGDHIGQTVEAYVDDIVIKTRKVDDLVNDLRIAFDRLRANGVKVNPEKCVFGVPRGMLLEYIVSQRGIEPNPEKVAALDRMGPIRDLKGVQKVLGCLASLSRFISRLGEKGLPLYRLLKKHERFSWTVEAQEALDKLKVTLAHAPILTPPRAASFCTSTSPRPPWWSALTSWWNVQRKGTPYQYRGPCITSAKCYSRPRHGTRRSRSCSTRWCSHGASSGTTSRPTHYGGLLVPVGGDHP